MLRTSRLAAAVIVVILGALLASADKARTGTERRATDKRIYDALCGVIDRGAALFNKNRDAYGCYRLFQGSLMTVQALLDHRPELQKRIDADLAKADKLPTYTERAQALRALLGHVLNELNVATPPAEAEKPKPPAAKEAGPAPTGKKRAEPTTVTPAEGTRKDTVEQKKPEVKKSEAPARVGDIVITGKILMDGKPVADARVQFVRKENVDDKSPGARTNADGDYEIKGLRPGVYRVVVRKEKSNIPALYGDEKLTPLLIEAKKTMTADFVLVRGQ